MTLKNMDRLSFFRDRPKPLFLVAAVIEPAAESTFSVTAETETVITVSVITVSAVTETETETEAIGPLPVLNFI